MTKYMIEFNSTMGQIMEIASTSQADVYHQLAREWMDGTAQKVCFEEYHVIAAFSVAEFLANQDGYTLFPDSEFRQ